MGPHLRVWRGASPKKRACRGAGRGPAIRVVWARLPAVAPRSPWAALPRFQRGAFGLFLVAAIASAILSDQPLGARLTLHPDAVLEGVGSWQPLTAPFLFPEGRLSGLLLTLIVQWIVAGPLESFWGTRRYLALVLGAGVFGYLLLTGLAWLVPSAGRVVVGGMTPVDLAAVVAFGVVHGRRPLQVLGVVPLSARAIALIVAAVSVLAPLARGEPWPTVVPSIGAMAVALLATTQPWRGGRSSGRVRRGSRRSKKDHLKVVSPDGKLLN